MDPYPLYTRDDEMSAATLADGAPRCSVYVPDRAMVVLGRGSKAELELDLDACQADRIPVHRRRGGGCAVVLDPGNVIVSLALAVEGIGRNKEHFARISGWLIHALAGAGVEGVTQRGVSDLCLGQRKVGGSCIQRARGLLHYGTTLLVSPDLTLMSRYLRHPPREPEYRAGRDHAAFVGQIVYDGGAPGLAAALEGSLDPGLLAG